MNINVRSLLEMWLNPELSFFLSLGISVVYYNHTGHAVAQLVEALRYNRKVASSIPDCVFGIFHWHTDGSGVDSVSNRKEYQ